MASFTPEQIEQFLQEFFDTVGRRQYIGARYVPIFGRKDEDSIAWDNTAPYEPLTIVLYNGDSYTSRTYVPAGIDILNQDYWALTGNYNAQIEAYRDEVLAFDQRITNNTAAISDEVNARQEADTALGNGISQEATARADADTALGNRITQETTTLGNRITQESAARTDADIALGNRITQESAARTDADIALGNATQSLGSMKVPFPVTPSSKYGTDGQVLRTNGDGTTQWQNPAAPTDQQASAAISTWLTQHPEATTTVQDGSLTYAKFSNALKSQIDGYKGYLHVNDDLNNYQNNGVYLIGMTSSQYNTLQNAPSMTLIGNDPSSLFLEIIHTEIATNNGLVLQRIHCCGYPSVNNRYATLARWGNAVNGVFTWRDWQPETRTAKGGLFSGGIGANSDLNNYQDNGIYLINMPLENYNTLLNAPSAALINNNPTALFLEVTHTAPNQNDGLVRQRIHCCGFPYVSQQYATLVRWGNNSGGTFAWYDWRPETPTARRVVRVGANKEFTSLLEGIIEAEKTKNSVVLVDGGTYDAVAEFKAKYGNDYFSSGNYTSKENFRGIPLTNGVHVIGYGKVTVTGGLSSSDHADAIAWWSIFNAGDDAGGANGYGFTLENITVKVLNSNIRYAIHDEYGGTDYDYINKYINCHFVIANGVADKNCIGGGLGKHGYIVIDNCTVDAPSYSINRRGINYHNNLDAGSQSEIYVKNCRIPNGTVGITWYGNTPADQKSMLYVNNCYLQREPIKQGETPEYTNENVGILAWNNEIAS